MKFLPRLVGVCVTVALAMTACGGSGSQFSSLDSNGPLPGGAAAKQSFSGTVEGLKSDGLVLTDGVQEISLGPLDAKFAFPEASDATSSLSIKSQPTNSSSICAVVGTVPSELKISCAYVPRFVYAVNFQTSDIRQFAIDASTGAMTFIRSVPWDIDGYSRYSDNVSVAVHPFKGVMYVSSPRTQQTTTYSIDPSTGYLTQVGSPLDAPMDRFGRAGIESDFSLVRGGNYAYALNSQPSSIDQYRVAADTGLLEYAGQFTINSMSHATVSPDGTRLFASTADRPNFSIYPLDPSNGAVGTPTLSPPVSARYVTAHPNGKLLYASGSAGITPFKFMQDGSLIAQPASMPIANPVLAYIDAVGSKVVSLNGSQIAAQNILDASEGTLGPATFTSTPGDPDALTLWPDGKFAFVVFHYDELPLMVYSISPSGAISALPVPAEISNTTSSAIALY